MKTAYLGLGANLGDAEENIRQAIDMLDADSRGSVLWASPPYRTRPVGIEDQPEFINAVVEIVTDRSPRELLQLIGEIEREMGRVRTIRWGPRVIDIDILLYENETVQENDLTVPHPRMMERAFVLVPLAEIAPDQVLPGEITAREAAARIDKSGVERIGWSRE